MKAARETIPYLWGRKQLEWQGISLPKLYKSEESGILFPGVERKELSTQNPTASKIGKIKTFSDEGKLEEILKAENKW